jgi:hypothetical protein
MLATAISKFRGLKRLKLAFRDLYFNDAGKVDTLTRGLPLASL